MSKAFTIEVLELMGGHQLADVLRNWKNGEGGIGGWNGHLFKIAPKIAAALGVHNYA